MFRRKPNALQSASMTHRFVHRDDNRSALALTASTMPQVATTAVADASLREYPCAVPGCSKPKDDPIHQG
jgi:hypothetical protein